MLFRCSSDASFDEKGLHSLPYMLTMTGSKWDSTKYLYQQNVLQVPSKCPSCGAGVGYKKDPYLADFTFKRGNCDKGPSDFKACFTYRCKNRACSLQQSIFADTFFENQKKPVNEILMCLFLWLSVSPPAMTQTLLGWGEKTVLHYFRLFRIMVSHYMMEFVAQDISEDIFTYDKVQIGGPGIEVQIDESAFGKRKYGLGHPVSTKWVFGGVEIVPDAYMKKTGGKFFAVVVKDRTKETLDDVIKKFIKPGSIIISDSFSSYKKLGERMSQYEHDMVNHSKNYKDPTTGACTNTVEGKWNKLKKAIPRQGFRDETVLQEYLGEQMWRYTNRFNLWEAAILALAAYVKREI